MADEQRCGILWTNFTGIPDSHGCIYRESPNDGHPWNGTDGPVHCFRTEDGEWIEWFSECAESETGGCCDIDDCEDSVYGHVPEPRWEFVVRCAVPECDELEIYMGLCMTHADEEYGDPNPSVEDLVGPL